MNWKICRTKTKCTPLRTLFVRFVPLILARNVVSNPHNVSLHLVSLFIPFRCDIFRIPFLCCVNKKSIKIFPHANGHETRIAKPRTHTHTHTYTPYCRLLQATVVVTTKPATKNARECFRVIFPCLTLNINISFSLVGILTRQNRCWHMAYNHFADIDSKSMALLLLLHWYGIPVNLSSR